MKRTLAARLLAWYDAGHRDLPWRRSPDPYRVWVSEIMLQQTRAEAVIPYYHRFLARFPDAAALALAPLDDVLACWSGLGYYSRARNMHRTAGLVAGGFPAGFDHLRQLPGIGDYTAAAIASIAFGLPYAVLDGNVLRVVARVTGDAADIGSARTRSRFREVAQGWLDRRRAGAFNQALMELGATVCLPRAPRCGECPLSALCIAQQSGRAAELPVKLRKIEPVEIRQELAVVARRGRILMWQRPADSKRLAGFWELPSPAQVPGLAARKHVGTFRHTITHHNYVFAVYTGSAPRAALALRWIPLDKMDAIPVSTTARKALRLVLPEAPVRRA